MNTKITATRISGGQTFRQDGGPDTMFPAATFAWKVARGDRDVIVVAANREEAIKKGRRHV